MKWLISKMIKKIQHRPAYVSMHHFDKMHWMEKFYAKTQNLLSTTNPENVTSVGQLLLKIFPLKGKNSLLENEL